MPAAGVEPGLLLPDLETSGPVELSIRRSGAYRELRFSTTVRNIGQGPVELVGALDERTNRVEAKQRLQRADGPPEERFAGVMVFHPEHRHWHLVDFATVELWTYRPDGSLDQLTGSTGKITFCLLDMAALPELVPNAAPEFIECDWQRQGISAGWSEIYDASLPGQQMDISAVGDGRYALRTTLDPANWLRESNDTNNSATIYIELDGAAVERLDSP